MDKLVNKMNLKRLSYQVNFPPKQECEKCNKTLIVDDNMFNIMSIQMLIVKVKLVPKGVDKALDGLKGL